MANPCIKKIVQMPSKKTDEYELLETHFIPEDIDFIQDQKTFEKRRKQLINEYEQNINEMKARNLLPSI